MEEILNWVLATWSEPTPFQSLRMSGKEQGRRHLVTLEKFVTLPLLQPEASVAVFVSTVTVPGRLRVSIRVESHMITK